MTPTGQCPVTKEVATTQSAIGDFIEVECPTCGTFRVAQSALAQLSNMPEGLSLDALSKAKKRADINEDGVPVIKTYDLVMS